MILLDTDHLTELAFPEGRKSGILTARMQTSNEDFATTVVSLEEQLRGWLAFINRLRDPHKQIPGYDRLLRLFGYLSDWEIVPFDERAADEFQRLRKQRVRLGTQDLKIASIALVNDALLLSANLSDFRQVPGLRVESWLEPESELGNEDPQAE
jgi:tRNA(fMet)-specific endonuclease VapC